MASSWPDSESSVSPTSDEPQARAHPSNGSCLTKNPLQSQLPTTATKEQTDEILS
ncbi:hypothetical protein PGT21_020693 [Puccinia graminis f. sp. tritici]|uniref:Uncharacterized protein n=1 Tax=Puccinia graminis f. sp. tritici TaxID=56615 RepID=A0A5B0PQH3_PUCGR|nr:hypothetical protein PGT21_020693 [Puccinia graminis f. sp. tritici]